MTVTGVALGRATISHTGRILPDVNIRGLGADLSTTVAINVIPADSVRSFRVAADSPMRQEGETAVFTISLIGQPPAAGAPATVDWTVGGSVLSADYTVSGLDTDGTLSFTALGDQRLNIAIVDDEVRELAEGLSLTLSNPANASLSVPVANVLIGASDEALTLDVTSPGDRLSEGTAANFMVGFSRSLTTTEAVTADWEITFPATNPATAADFDVLSGSLTIPAGQSEAAIPITPIADNINEGEENFIFTISNPAGGGSAFSVQLSRAPAVPAAIAASNRLIVSVTAPTPPAVNEGQGTVFPLVFSGAASLTEDITIAYSLGTISVTPVDTNAGSITIAADADAIAASISIGIPYSGSLHSTSPAETLSLTLTSVSGGAAGGEVAESPGNAAEVTVNYVDSLHTFTFTDPPATVAEGASATYTVARSGPDIAAGGTLEIQWAVTHGATVAADFTAPTSGSVTFSDDDATKTFAIAVANDTLNEADEAFTIALTAANIDAHGGSAVPTPAPATITDNPDDAIAITIARAATQAATADEGGTATFTITLSGGTRTDTVTVPFTVAGPDAAEFDITTPSLDADDVGGSVDFTAADATEAAVLTADVVVDLVDDTLNEAAEPLTISGGALAAGLSYTDGGDEAEVSVTDNDAISVRIELISSDRDPDTDGIQIGEGREVEYRVHLSVASEAEVTVPFTIGGEAEAADYVLARPSPVTFAAGVTQSIIALTLAVDADTDASEDLTVSLDASGYTAAGAIARSTTVAEQAVTIKVTQQAAVRSLTLTRYATAAHRTAGTPAAAGSSVDETDANDVTLYYRIGVDGTDFSQPTTVTWDIEYVGDSSVADFTAVSDTVSMTNSGDFDITIVGDELNEPDEQFRVHLQVDPTIDGGTNAADAAETVTITDDDAIEITGVVVPAAEGGSAVVRLTLSETPTRNITINFATGPTAATDDVDAIAADYDVGLGISVYDITAINPQRLASLLVDITDDAINEGEEAFSVSFDADDISGHYGDLTLTDRTFTVTIPANDPVTAAIAAPDPATVDEGGSVTFGVTLSGVDALAADLAVAYTTAGLSVTPTDANGGSITIPAGTDFSGDIVLAIPFSLELDSNSGRENLVVTLSGVSGGGGGTVAASPGDAATVQVTYLDHQHTLAFDSPDTAVTEGETVNLSLSRTGPALNAGFTVMWTLVNAATEDADFAGTFEGDINFTTDSDTVTFSFGTAADTLNEGGEDFNILLTIPDAASLAEGGIAVPAELTLTLNDDAADAIAVTIARAATQAATVGEAETAAFTVTITGGTRTGDVVVPFTVEGLIDGEFDITAPSGVMADAVGASVTFAAADTAVTTADIAINLLDDTLNEATETMTVTGGTPTTAGTIAYADDGNAASVDLTDDDTISVAIAVAAGTVADDVDTADGVQIGEGREVEFTITISVPASEIVYIPFSIGGEVEAADYALTTASPLPVFPGGLATTVVVALMNDADTDTSEDLTVTLDTSGYTAPGDITRSATVSEQSATVDIVPRTIARTLTVTRCTDSTCATTTADQPEEGDSDRQQYYQIGIADGGTAFTTPTAVTWSIRHVETAHADFVQAGLVRTLMMTDSVILTFTIIGDGLNEVDEAFVIGLSIPDDTADGGTDATVLHNGIIIDDDAIAATITADTNLTEGGNAAINIALGTTLTAAASVAYAIAPGTAAAADYSDSAGGTLNFASGATGGDFTIAAITDDALNEAAETFTVTITAADFADDFGEAAIASGGEQTFIIAANDRVTAAIAAPDPATVDEGQSVTYTITLSGAAELTAAITVGYSLSALSVTPVDAAGGSIVFPAGTDLSDDITVDIPLSQTLTGSSPDETLTVTLNTIGGGGGGVIADAPDNAASVTVNYVDTAHSIAFDNPATAVSEGDRLTYTIARTGPAIADGNSITVDWTFTAGGTSAADFVGGTAPAGGSLTFSGSEASKDIAINIAQDTDDEAAETFTLALSATAQTMASNGGVFIGGDVSVTIGASDQPVTLTITPPAGDLIEGTEANFAVSFSQAVTTTAPITADWRITFPPASGAFEPADGDDFGGVTSGTVTIPVGLRSANIALTAATDGINEAEETFLITISNAAGGGEIATPNVHFTDNDASGMIAASNPAVAHLALASPLNAAIAEGANAIFSVTLRTTAAVDSALVTSAGAVCIPFSTVVTAQQTPANNAASGADIAFVAPNTGTCAARSTAATVADATAAATASVLIPAGSSVATFQIAARLDGVAEGATAESLSVTLGAPDAADESGSVTAAATAASVAISNSAAARALTLTRYTDPARTRLAAAASVDEGDSDSVLYYRIGIGSSSRAFANATTVTWTVTHGNPATAVADFAAVSGTLQMTTTADFAITMRGDELNEADEQFTVALSVTDPTADGGTNTDAADAVTITDDDPITITAPAPAGGNALTEGQSFTVTVNLGTPPGGDVTLDYALNFASGTGNAAAADLSDTSGGSITIPAGSNPPTADITVRVVDDAINEAAEAFTLAFDTTDLAGHFGVAAIGDGTAAVFDLSIVASDPVTAAITAPTPATVRENESVTFAVTLSGATELAAPVSVAYTTAGTTDTIPAGSISIPAGSDLRGDIVLAIANNLALTADTADETLSVTLSGVIAGGGGVVASPPDDVASVTVSYVTAAHIFAFDAPAASVTEGGSVTYAVTRSGPAIVAAGGITVAWAVTAATATAADFSGGTVPGGDLVFTAGQTRKTFSVATTDDSDAEGDETFSLALSTADATLEGGLALPTARTVTILDNEGSTFTITAGPTALTETDANAATAAYTITRSGIALTAVVTWTVKHATTDADDFAAATTDTVTFTAGDTTQTFTLTIAGDNVLESDETFTLGLAVDGHSVGADYGPVTVANDDVEFRISSDLALHFVEQDENYLVNVFTSRIHRDGAALTVQTPVSWSVDHVSTESSDFRFTSGTVIFNPGDNVKSFSVLYNGDRLAEGDEQFRLRAWNSAHGYGPYFGPVTVRDNDTAVFTVTDGDTGDTAITETDTDAVLHYVVARSGSELGEPADIAWEIVHADMGDATDDADFAAVSGIVRFRAGGDYEPLNITVIGDNTVEAAESFSLRLSGPSYTRSGDDYGPITITDDDTAFAITAGPTALTETNANAPTAAYTITRSGLELTAASTTVTWTVHHAASGGTNDADFTAVTGSVDFAAGDDSKDFTLTVVGDIIGENIGNFTLRLTSPGHAGGDYAVSLTDDDGSAFAVTAGPAALTETDEALTTAAYTITRSGADLTAATTVRWRVTHPAIAGTLDADFAAVSGMVQFAAGDDTQTFTLVIIGDEIAEGDENFTLSATAVGGFVGNPYAVTIADNDTAFTITAGPATVNETDAAAETDAYTITRIGAELTDAATVTWTVNHAATDGTSDADFTATSGTVEFAAGDDSKEFTLSVIGDSDAEGDESFTLSAAASGHSAGGVYAVTIADDDDTPAFVLAAPTDPAAEGRAPVFTVTYQAGDGSTALAAAATLTLEVLNNAPDAHDSAATREGVAFAADWTGGTAKSQPAGTVIATATVTIPAGTAHDAATNATLPMVVDDTFAENAEHYRVRITAASLPSGAIAAPTFVQHTIAPSDPLMLSVVAPDPPLLLTEGDAAALRVNINLGSSAITDVWETPQDNLNVRYIRNGVVSESADIPRADIVAAGYLSLPILNADDNALSLHKTDVYEVNGVTAVGFNVAVAPNSNAIDIRDNDGRDWVITARDGGHINADVAEDADPIASPTTGGSDAESYLRFTGVQTGAVRAETVITYCLFGTASGGIATDADRDYTWPDGYDHTINATVNHAQCQNGRGTVTFAAGDDDTYRIPIALNDDALNEGDETIYGRFLSVTIADNYVADKGNIHFTTDLASRVIKDNDPVVAHLARASGSGAVTEGDSVTYSVTLRNADNTADVASSGVICVPFTTAVTAQQTPANAAGNPDIALIAPNNDTCAAPDTAVSVAHANGAATASVEIPAGRSSADFTVMLQLDGVNEGATAESLSVALGTPVARAGAGAATADTTAVTVAVNDLSVARGLVIAAATAAADEGEALTFAVRVTGAAVTAAFNVAWTVTSGSDEVTPTSGMVAFGVGDTEQTISLTATDDADNEDADTVTVTLTDPCGSGICAVGGRAGLTANEHSLRLATAAASGTVNPSDRPLTLSIAAPAADLAEGTPADFTVRFTESITTTAPVTAQWRITFPADGGGTTPVPAAANDLSSALSGSVSIAAGESSATVAVTAANDTLNESAERFIVTLSAPDGGGPIAAPTLHATDAVANADIAESDLIWAGFIRKAGESGSVDEGDTINLTAVLLTSSSDTSPRRISAGDVCVGFRHNSFLPNPGAPNTADNPDFALAPENDMSCATGNPWSNIVPSGVRGAVVIPAGQSEMDFSILVRLDGIDDPGQSVHILSETGHEFRLSAGRRGTGPLQRWNNNVSVAINNINTARTLSLAAATATADEGGNLTFTVTVAGVAVSETFNVAWTAAPAAEVDTASGMVTFAAGATPLMQTITVPITDDTDEEDAETVTVTLTDPCPASGTCNVGGRTGVAVGEHAMFLPGASDSASGTITANDAPITLSLSAPAADLSEGTAGNFSVEFTEPVTTTAAVTADWTITFPASSETVNPANAADFDSLTGSVTIPAAASSANLPIIAMDDSVSEAAESFILTLSNAAGGGADIQPIVHATDDNATAVIAANDPAVAHLSRTATAAVDEGNAVTFTVTLRNTANDANVTAGGEVCVPFTTAVTTQQTPANDAASGADIALVAPDIGTCAARGTAVAVADATAAATASVLIPANTATATFQVMARFDGIDEGGTAELLSVTLGAPISRSGAGSVTHDTTAATADIANANAARALSIADATAVDEGGALVFTVSVAGIAVTEQFDVDYTITSGGGEVDGADNGTITFGVGETSKDITLTATDDADDEGDDTVTVTLSDPCGAGICAIGGRVGLAATVPSLRLSDAAADGTIRQSDRAVTLSIGAPTGDLTEGTEADFSVSFSESVTTTAAVTATWTITFPTASMTVNPAASADFGDNLTGTATIAAGESSVDVDITATDDAINEAAESFIITLSAPDGGGAIAAPVLHDSNAAATAAIAANDPVVAHIARTMPTDGSVDEGRDATFTVTLRNAADNEDVMSAGAFCIPFTTAITNAQTPANTAGNADIALASPNTGACGSRNTAVTVAANGAATASVLIAAGQMSETFQIRARFDGLDEGGTAETLSVTVGTPVTADAATTAARGGAATADSDAATVTITNTNAARTLSIAATTARVDEGGALVFTVTVAGAAITAGFNVNWNITAGGGEVDGADSGMVNFAAGETTKEITLTATDDAASEGDDTVTVAITDPCPTNGMCDVGGRPSGLPASAPTLRLTTAAASGTVSESDRPVTVSIGAPAADLAEGTLANFSVSFPESVTTTEPVTADWAITFPTASATVNPATAADIDGMVTGSVTIPANASNANIPLTATADSVNEAAESFIITLSNIAGGGPIAAPVLHNTDNDTTADIAASDPVVAHIALTTPTDGSVDEGRDATFTVTLRNAGDTANATSAGAFCVPFSTAITNAQTPANTAGNADIALASPNTGACGSRNTAVTVAANGAATASVLIPANSSMATFQIRARFDGLDEGGTAETLSVTVGTPVTADAATTAARGGAATADSDAATVAINNTNAARTLSIAATTARVDEGGALVFTVTVAGAAVTAGFNVNWDITAGGGEVDGADSGTVNFAAGETEKVIRLTATDDSDDEGEDTVTVTIDNPCGAGVCGVGGRPSNLPTSAPSLRLTTATANGVIGESDRAVTVSIGAPAADLAEGTLANFSVSFTESVTTTAPVTATWTITFPAASMTVNPAASGDFGGTLTGSVSIPIGANNANIPLTATADSVNEAAESFIITLSNVAGGGPIAAPVLHDSNDAATADIAASDPIVAHIARTAPTNGGLDEGRDATFTVTLRNSGDTANATSAGAFCIPFSTAITNAQTPANTAGNADIALVSPNTGTCAARNTAVTPAANGAATASVLIAAGQFMATFQIRARFDGLDEGSTAETLSVTVGTPVADDDRGGTATADSDAATVTINNTNAARTLSIAATTASVDEGGELVFTITVSGAAITANFGVDWNITAGGGEVDGADSGTANFAAGVTSQTIRLTATDDTDDEGEDTVTVAITNPCGAGVCAVGGRPSNLPANAPSLRLTTATASGTVSESDRAVTVSIGAPAADLTEGTLANFSVSFPESVTTTEPVTATWTITFPTASATVNPATATDIDGMVTGTVTIPTGASNANIPLTATADSVNEAAESFIITLSNIAGGGPIAAPVLHNTDNDTTANIAASDAAVAHLELTSPTNGGLDEGGNATFTVTLRNAANTADVRSAGDICVPFSTVVNSQQTTPPAAANAAGNADIALIAPNTGACGSRGTAVTPAAANGAATASVLIRAGQAAADFQVRARFDNIDEGATAESLAVSISAPVVAAAAGAATADAAAASVAINNINAARTLSIAAPAAAVDEGGDLVFTVTVAGEAVTEAFNVGWNITAGGGEVDGGDSGTVTIGVGASSAAITLTATDDSDDEGDDTVTVTITDPCGAGVCGVGGRPGGLPVSAPSLRLTDATASGTIRENDHRVTLAITAPGGNLSEGTAANFTVRFTESVTTTAAVTARWTVTFPAASPTVTPANAADFAVTSGTVTIPAGGNNAPIAITPAADGVNEAAESFSVTLSAPAGGGAIAQPVLHTANAAAAAVIATSDPLSVALAAPTPATAFEGEAIRFAVNVTGTSPIANAAVTVNYSVTAGGGSAPPFTDPGNGSVDISVAGGGFIVVRSTPTADIDSGTGTLSVRINSVALTAGGGTARLAASPNDRATVTVTFREFERFFAVTVDNATPREGDGVTFTVALTGTVPTAAATVDWSITGDGDDYSGGDSGSLSFTALGERAVNITITDDDLIEGNGDTLTFSLSNADGGGGTGSGITTASVGVTITDNDAIRVTISGPANINEEASATYSVGLGGRVLRETAIAITAIGATAGDFSLSVNNISVAALGSGGTFTVTTTDGGGEGTPDRTLRLSASVAGFDPGTLAVTITEDVPAERAQRVMAPAVSVAQSVGQLASTAVVQRLSVVGGSNLTLGGQTFAVLSDDDKESASGAWAANPFEREQMLNASGGGGESMSAKEFLRNSSFALSLGNDSLSLWGSGGRLSTDGEVDGVRYNGDSTAWHLGADTRWDDGLLGLAVAQTSGKTDFTADDISSRLDTELTSVHPYVARHWNGARVWGALGYGSGSAELREGEDVRINSDLNIINAAAGVTINSSGNIVFNFGGAWNRAELSGGGGGGGRTLPKVTADALRVNAAVELGFNFTDKLRPFATLNIRYDFGDGDDGGATDLGGGVEWNSPRSHIRLEGATSLQGRGADEETLSIIARRSGSGGGPYARWNLDGAAAGTTIERGRFSLGVEVGVADNGMEFKNLVSGEIRF